MSTVAARKARLKLGPDSAGLRLSLQEFDSADFDVEEECWRYELIDGVLVVSPSPLEMERDPNEELGRLLRNWREIHPEGKVLDKTLPEHTVRTTRNRRRVDRVLWIGLGRVPTPKDVPSVVAEFVSKGKRNWRRDYIEKRDEYLALGVAEYWLFDRFQHTLTVFWKEGDEIKTRVLGAQDVFATPLLPGFELHVGKLFAIADDWL